MTWRKTGQLADGDRSSYMLSFMMTGITQVWQPVNVGVLHQLEITEGEESINVANSKLESSDLGGLLYKPCQTILQTARIHVTGSVATTAGFRYEPVTTHFLTPWTPLFIVDRYASYQHPLDT